MPFSTEQFLAVFRDYNQWVWPSQPILVIAALAVVIVAFRERDYGGRLPSLFLGTVWLWMGVVYHLVFFRAVNPVALVFGVLFIAQGMLFLWIGVLRGRLTFQARSDAAGITGGLLLLYAIGIYPLLSYLLGHRYPESPTFGLPCPTTIFTFGLLLWAQPPVSRSLLVVPVLWSVVGTLAAFQFGMPEDAGLFVAGVLATSILVVKTGSRGAAGHAQWPAPSRP